MNISMRKIMYYENILEFKRNSKEQLNLDEINNWLLCRTCLEDTSEDDINMEKMSVMDVMQGTFRNVKEIFVEATDIKISENENLPQLVCKECLNKITTLYYFLMQVRSADKVLKMLADQMKCQEDYLEYELINSLTENIPDENMLCGVEEDCVYSKENDGIIGNVSGPESKTYENELETLAEETSEYFEKISDAEVASIRDKEATLFYSDVRNASSDDETHLNNNFLECSDISNADNKETITTIIITREKVQNEVKKSKKKARKATSMTGYRHKQPRIESPLLNDFDCAICQNSFGRQRDLVQHVRESHPNSKAYECRVCGNLFSHIQSLSRHMNSHKEAVILNECDVCSKAFVRVDDLKRHIKIHTGERPFVCSICEKSYRQHSDLKYHMERHENMNSKLRRYECSKCKQTYISRTGLYLHNKKHHREGSHNKFSHNCRGHKKSLHFQSELKHVISQEDAHMRNKEKWDGSENFPENTSDQKV